MTCWLLVLAALLAFVALTAAGLRRMNMATQPEYGAVAWSEGGPAEQSSGWRKIKGTISDGPGRGRFLVILVPADAKDDYVEMRLRKAFESGMGERIGGDNVAVKVLPSEDG